MDTKKHSTDMEERGNDVVTIASTYLGCKILDGDGKMEIES